jgi:hypothetical protein
VGNVTVQLTGKRLNCRESPTPPLGTILRYPPFFSVRAPPSTLDVTNMHELSDTKIRNAKSADKEYTLADGQGLSVRLQTNGTKIWLYRYRFGG